jgi:hypothetical protein
MNEYNTNGKYLVDQPVTNKTEILFTTHIALDSWETVELRPCFTSTSSATQVLHYNRVYTYNMVYNPGAPSLLNALESGMEAQVS